MAIKRPDIYEHNNPNNAVVDSMFVRGGGRVVATLANLTDSTMESKIDQLSDRVTLVWVTNAGSGVGAFYQLKDKTQITSLTNGWTKLELGGNFLPLDLTAWTQVKTNANTLSLYSGNASGSGTLTLDGSFYGAFDYTSIRSLNSRNYNANIGAHLNSISDGITGAATSMQAQAHSTTDGDIKNSAGIVFSAGTKEDETYDSEATITIVNNTNEQKFKFKSDGKIYVNDVVYGGSSDITIDPVPTEDSTNAVSSGGVYTELENKSDIGHGHSTADISGLSAVASTGNYNDLLNKPDAVTISDASTTTKGIVKLSVAPVSATDPIAVGTNDSRLTDQRTPVDGSVTNSKLDSTTQGKVSTGNKETHDIYLEGNIVNNNIEFPITVKGKVSAVSVHVYNLDRTSTVDYSPSGTYVYTFETNANKSTTITSTTSTTTFQGNLVGLCQDDNSEALVVVHAPTNLPAGARICVKIVITKY